MKIVKKIKILIIILLFVTIVFTLLGSFNIYDNKEGMTDVPKCSNSLDDDEDELNNNWFIRSSLVPPVCTSCPYYNNTGLRTANDISGSIYALVNPDTTKNSNNTNTDTNIGNVNVGNRGDDKSVNTNLTQTSDYYNKNINATKITNQNDNSVKQDNSNKQNITQDNSVNQDFSQSESADSKFNNLFGNNSIMFGSFGGGGSGSATINSPTNLNNDRNSRILPTSSPAYSVMRSSEPYKGPDPETTQLVNDLKLSINKLNQQKSSVNSAECPACPACERCPEPAFECKKVPNYRSPSIDNYMPVPILNDFSRF
jgi:hypothetical protein